MRITQAFTPKDAAAHVEFREEPAIVGRLLFGQGAAVKAHLALEYSRKRNVASIINRDRSRLLLIRPAKPFRPKALTVRGEGRDEDIRLVRLALEISASKVDFTLKAPAYNYVSRGGHGEAFEDVVFVIPEGVAPYVPPGLIQLCHCNIVAASRYQSAAAKIESAGKTAPHKDGSRRIRGHIDTDLF